MLKGKERNVLNLYGVNRFAVKVTFITLVILLFAFTLMTGEPNGRMVAVKSDSLFEFFSS